MIVLHKENISKYLEMDARLNAAFRMLAEGLVEHESLGKFEDSDHMYHMIQCYETKSREDTRWESHQNWIDIQYLRTGQERIDVLVSKKGLEKAEQNKDMDVIFYRENGLVRENQVLLEDGMLAVFYPEDIHRPGICLEQPQTIEKVVFKIRVG